MRFLLLPVLLAVGSLAQSTTISLDSLLVQLEVEMEKRAEYDRIKENKINSLKDLVNDKEITPERQFFVHNKILEEYIPYSFDSAMHYVDLNLELAKKTGSVEFKNETNLHLATILAYSGRFLEAVDAAKSIDSKQLTTPLKIELFAVFTRVYSDLYLFTHVNESRDNYGRLYRVYNDSLKACLEPESAMALSILEKEFRDSRQLIDCKRVNTRRLNQAVMGTREYSTICFERAILYQIEGNTELFKQYLALSAISDIKASVKDNASLSMLALELYNEDHIDQAYKYIMFSFEDAAFFNSRLRFVQISSILPLISAAYQLKTDRQKAELRRFLIVISLLVLVLLAAVIAIFTQIKIMRHAKIELQEVNAQLMHLNNELQHANSRLNGLNDELLESNHVKEHYIGNFLAMCSDYVDKLDSYRKMVNKHITTHKIDELFTKTKSERFIKEELDEFYNNFDNIFLHIYPTFVEELNQLLEEGERFELKNEERLSTELRIFALIRLGINDSSQIAHLLRYSVNTIYNYRVKVKNKAAVDRNEFENLVMKIGAQIASNEKSV